MSLNPNTSTRAEFTASYLSLPLPSDSSVNPKWSRLVNSLLALIKALGEHEGMRNNNGQTYMTPAKDKNVQYFAWDFVGRTIVSLFVLFFDRLNIVTGSSCHERVVLYS
jgi:hypothetical protein